MEQVTFYLNALIGILVTVVTEYLKKWLGIDSPILKFIIVGLLSSIFAGFLSWIYVGSFSIPDSVRLAFPMVVVAIFGNVIRKTAVINKTGGSK